MNMMPTTAPEALQADATAAHVRHWVGLHPLAPMHVDCATTVMLKILDGKCKMSSVDKVVMALLYDQVNTFPGLLFGAEVHRRIAEVRAVLDDETRQKIYEQRVLAETAISRPVMKAFKAMIRQEGLFLGAPEEKDEDA